MKSKRVRWLLLCLAILAVVTVLVFAIALPKGSLRYTWRRLFHIGEPVERAYRAIFDYVFPIAAKDVAGEWKDGTTAREFTFRVDREDS